MKATQIQTALRTVGTKGKRNESRRKGRVPGVLYGKGSENVLVEVDMKELLKVLRTHGANSLLLLRVGNGSGEEHLAMVGEIQYDTFHKYLNHVDFHRVSMTESVRTSVAIKLIGPAAGEKNGGVIDILLREVEVEGTPLALPEHFDVDITGLDIEDSLHVGDLALPEGVTLVTAAEEVLVVVHSPRRAEEVATTETPGAAPAGETKSEAP